MTNDRAPVTYPLKSLKNLIFPPRPPSASQKTQITPVRNAHIVASSRVEGGGQSRVKKRFLFQRVIHCELVSAFFHLPVRWCRVRANWSVASGHLENFSADSHVKKCPLYDFINLSSTYLPIWDFSGPRFYYGRYGDFGAIQNDLGGTEQKLYHRSGESRRRDSPASCIHRHGNLLIDRQRATRGAQRGAI